MPTDHGDLPPERTPAKPFEYTTVDLFGPYEVKEEVRKKVRLKVWGIVFCCMASRALHTDVVSDQSSEGFLLDYKRFTALRGHPRKLWSDPGKNFVGARPALRELYVFLDQLGKSEVENETSKHGTWSWKFHPVNSPHRNGAAEVAVRTVKRALHNLGGDGCFTWSEFQTFLYMAANLANETHRCQNPEQGRLCRLHQPKFPSAWKNWTQRRSGKLPLQIVKSHPN